MIEARIFVAPSDRGEPLADPAREALEGFFGADLSDVQIHVGPEAGALGALAFTCGPDIHFAPGRYDLESFEGRRLLGHEVAHVLQQRAGRVPELAGRGAVVDLPELEAEADRMGDLFAEGRRAPPPGAWKDLAWARRAPARPGVPGGGIQRKTARRRLVDTLMYLRQHDRERYERYMRALGVKSIDKFNGINSAAQFEARLSRKVSDQANLAQIGGNIRSGASVIDLITTSKDDRRAIRAALLGPQIAQHATGVAVDAYDGPDKRNYQQFARNPQNFAQAYTKTDLMPDVMCDDFWMLIPVDNSFNCLAHALALVLPRGYFQQDEDERVQKDVWVDNYADVLKAIGADVSKSDVERIQETIRKSGAYSIAVFDRILDKFGYAVGDDALLGDETSIPVGSIVGYARVDKDDVPYLAHFARRVVGGWESKLGEQALVFHAQLKQVSGVGEGRNGNGYPSRVYLQRL